MKELQNALKNPALNFGLILGEGTKRARKAIGLTSGGGIEGLHPNLADSGVLLSKVAYVFSLYILSLRFEYLFNVRKSEYFEMFDFIILKFIMIDIVIVFSQIILILM